MKKSELEKEISRCVAAFLDQQLGEHAIAVETFLAGNTLTVRAANCFSPAEKLLTKNEHDWQLFQNFKHRQFEHVKMQLQERLEQITACKVINIVSVIDQDGMRFEVVTLSKYFEH